MRGEGENAAGEAMPTVFHVTHWKAGSTWIDAILRRSVPDRVVLPKRRVAHFLDDPLKQGGVYPRMYVTRGQFERVALPERWSRFVVIRDLRDTLVSAYFSVKFSHDVSEQGAGPRMREMRDRLRRLSFKDGLEEVSHFMMVAQSEEIQRSWVDAGEQLIRYEDLLEHDAEILERVLLDECGLRVEPEKLRSAIRRSRFAAMSGGRATGHEDHNAHQRKGMAGDWRHYLRGSLKDHFKRRWGELLIETGYETDLDW